MSVFRFPKHFSNVPVFGTILALESFSWYFAQPQTLRMEDLGTNIATKKFSTFFTDLATFFPVKLIFTATISFDELIAFFDELEFFSLLSVFTSILVNVQTQHINQKEKFMEIFDAFKELGPMQFVLFTNSPNFGWIIIILLWTLRVLISISSAEH